MAVYQCSTFVSSMGQYSFSLFFLSSSKIVKIYSLSKFFCVFWGIVLYVMVANASNDINLGTSHYLKAQIIENIAAINEKMYPSSNWLTFSRHVVRGHSLSIIFHTYHNLKYTSALQWINIGTVSYVTTVLTLQMQIQRYCLTVLYTSLYQYSQSSTSYWNMIFNI